MAPLDWIRVHLPLKPAGPVSHPSLGDPEYLRLYQQYITSLESFVREAEVAISLVSKEGLPGPRRQVDFGRLNLLRRFYERDAYLYFTYRPHLRGPLPPDTRRERARGHLKDAQGAQLLGNEKRAEGDRERILEEVNAICVDVWNRYQKSPRPPAQEPIRELSTALGLAQSAGLETPVVEQMRRAMAELGETGQYF